MTTYCPLGVCDRRRRHCRNPSWCGACRAADERKGNGERPIGPARQRQPIRRVADDSWLRAIVRKVVGASVGERNSILFWASCRCGEAALEGKVPANWVTEVMVEAGLRAGLTQKEAKETVASGMRTGGVR
jgi:hypothetical protein